MKLFFQGISVILKGHFSAFLKVKGPVLPSPPHPTIFASPEVRDEGIKEKTTIVNE